MESLKVDGYFVSPLGHKHNEIVTAVHASKELVTYGQFAWNGEIGAYYSVTSKVRMPKLEVRHNCIFAENSRPLVESLSR